METNLLSDLAIVMASASLVASIVVLIAGIYYIHAMKKYAATEYIVKSLATVACMISLVILTIGTFKTAFNPDSIIYVYTLFILCFNLLIMLSLILQNKNLLSYEENEHVQDARRPKKQPPTGGISWSNGGISESLDVLDQV